MADQSRSAKTHDPSEGQKQNESAGPESKEKPTSSAATSTKPKRDKWRGQNPVIAMREASAKAGFTFVEDPNHPIYTGGSSITFMGPTLHPPAGPSVNEDGNRPSSSPSEPPTQHK